MYIIKREKTQFQLWILALISITILFAFALSNLSVAYGTQDSQITINHLNSNVYRWGLDIVTLSGNASTTNQNPTEVVVDWNDGSVPDQVPISDSVWGPINHIYDKNAVGTKNVTAQLVQVMGEGKHSKLASANSDEFQIIAHKTTTTLLSISNVRWSQQYSLSGSVLDIDSSSKVGNALLTFSGTGAVNLPNEGKVFTSADGSFNIVGIAPNVVLSGWSVQGHYAGDLYYHGSESSINTYSTLKHLTSLSLSSPTSVPWGRPTSISATLKDTSNSNLPIINALIHFDGTGAVGISDKTTDGNGIAAVSGTSPNSVATNWSVQGHYAGDSLYYSKDSVIKTYSTTKHATSLSLSSPTSVPWGRPTSISATLKDTSNASTPIAGATISWNGTGTIGINDKTTDGNGIAAVSGTSPNSVATNWSVQGHYAGDSLYYSKDSVIKTYSTTKHATSLSLTISPKTPLPGTDYHLDGILGDTTAATIVSDKTVSFVSDPQIDTIGVTATTDANGIYETASLNAPFEPDSHAIAVKFPGDSLYSSSSSANIIKIIGLSHEIVDLESMPVAYIISSDGTQAYALNTATGNIDFHGSDAGFVINSAISSTGTNGRINIKSGTYFVDSTIRPTSGIQIIGEDTVSTILKENRDQSTILNAHPNDPSVGIEDHDITIGNFTIDNSNHKGDVINFVSAENSRIFSITIGNVSSMSDALDFDGSRNMLVEHTRFYNIGGSAVHISGSFDGWQTHRGSNNITIIDSFASNVGKNRKIGAYNMFAWSDSISGTSNNTLSDITVENSYGGIEFTSIGQGNKVSDIVVNGTTYRGIDMTGSNNLVERARIVNTNSHGIIVHDATNCTINDVEIFGSAYNNIALTKNKNVTVSAAELGNIVNKGYSNIYISDTSRSLVDNPDLLYGATAGSYAIEEAGSSDYNIINAKQSVALITKIIGEHTILNVIN
jgi:hypothetical protein